jgi:hypothetical protein
VWDPSLELIRTTTSSLGPTQISAKAHGFIYTTNPVFNHGDYRLHILSAGVDTSLVDRLSLHLLYLYRRKDFTSDLVADTHFNRRDDTHQGVAEFRYAMTGAATLTFGVQRTQRTSTNVLRSFQDTQVSIGGQYRF